MKDDERERKEDDPPEVIIEDEELPPGFIIEFPSEELKKELERLRKEET